MLKGKKIGAIVATIAIMASMVSAPAMALSNARFLSRGIETAYNGTTLENRAYQNIKNGSFDLYYVIAMRDRYGNNIGPHSGYVRNKRYKNVKVTSSWVDRSYGTNGTIHVEVWEL